MHVPTAFTGKRLRSARRVVLGLVSSCAALHAQPLAVDPDFAPTFITQFTNLGHMRVMPLTGGGFIAAGSFTFAGTTPVKGLARLTPHGTPDPTFTYAGAPSPSGFTASDEGVIPLPDGRILVYERVNDTGTWNTRFKAYLPSGAVDPAFTDLTIHGGYVLQVVPQRDGGVLLAGLIPEINGIAFEGLARITPDGRLDTGFVLPLAGQTSVVSSVVISAGGTITASGQTTAPVSFLNFVRRFHANGAPDTGFTPVIQQGIGIQPLTLLASQADEKLIVAGKPTVRWNANGSLDPTFNPALLPGTLINRAVALDNGQLLIQYESDPAASTLPAGLGSVRLLAANGSLVTEYRSVLSETGTLQIHAVTASGDVLLRGVDVVLVTVIPNAPIFIGASPNLEYRSPRFTLRAADGTLSPTFEPELGFPGTVSEVASQGSGHVLVSGDFNLVDGAPARGLIRLERGGGRDLTFAPPESPQLPSILGGTITASVAQYHLQFVQPDGRLIAFILPRGSSPIRTRTVRLLPDGSLDPSFDLDSTMAVNRPRILDVASDGRILAIRTEAVGSSSSPIVTRHLSIFAADGSPIGDLPTIFSGTPLYFPGGIPSPPEAISALRISEARFQGTDRLLVTGLFDEVNGEYRPGIARLHLDGSLDEMYVPEIPPLTHPATFRLVSEGRALMHLLEKSALWSTQRTRRLLADGRLDPDFHLSPEESLMNFREQADGSYLELRFDLRRFLSDGARDLNVSVNLAGGSSGPPAATLIDATQLDDKTTYVAGRFPGAGSVAQGKLVRLVPVDTPGITVQPTTQTVVAGRETSLQVAAGDLADTSFQWQRNGIDIPGATSSRLRFDPARPSDAGVYRAVVTAGSHVYLSNAVTISVAANSARLVNFSARSRIRPEGPPQIAGFVINHATPQPVLLRAIGPSLTQLGVPTPLLRNPSFRLFTGPSPMLDGISAWDPLIIQRSQQVGAFDLIPSTPPPLYTEYGIAPDLGTGSFTAQTAATDNNDGVSLFEFYDASPANLTDFVRNVSLRGRTAPGADTMIGGFVIKGNGPLTLLLRGVGPELATMDVPEVIGDPRITLFSGTTAIETNDNWEDHVGGSLDALNDAILRSGAFPLEPGSTSAALFITLNPGNYTIHATGANNTAGEVLLEIYVIESP